jgi:hypothetical protein
MIELQFHMHVVSKSIQPFPETVYRIVMSKWVIDWYDIVFRSSQDLSDNKLQAVIRSIYSTTTISSVITHILYNYILYILGIVFFY